MKRIISILLSALMVIAIIPVSVLMVSAKTVTIEDQSLAAGQSYEYVLDLTTVDTSKDIVLKFNAHQPTAVGGGSEDNAVLSINGARTLRVTTGGAMHIWDEAAGAAVANSTQWNGYTNAQDVVVTINVASGTANFVYNNRNVNLTSLDLTGDNITFKFGGVNTSALTVTNISIEYSDLAGEEPEEPEVPMDTLCEIGYNAFASWANGTYVEQTVTTNGTDGDVVIVFTPARNNWNSSGNNLLSVNGVSLITTGGSGGYNLGSTNVAADFTARAITVTIDVATGDATIVDAAGNSGTANVGAIGDSFTLKINQDQNNGWELTSLVAQQVIGNELSTEEPEVPMDTLCEVGYTAFAGWSSGTYVEQTVTTNGTNGDVVIVFTPARNNWQTAVGANLLSVNGVSLITNAGSGNYNLGSTTVAAGGTARVITVTINVATGDATIVDTQGNSGTANVGAIGDKFTFKINQDQNDGWELTSLVAKQVIGEYVDNQSRENYSTSYDDFSSTTAPTGAINWPSGRTEVADGVLTVVPNTDTSINRLNVGSSISSVAGGILTFDFKIPVLPEEGGIAILHDRSQFISYVAISQNEETGVWEGTVGSDMKYGAVEIVEDTFYTATIIFGTGADDNSKVFINGTYVGLVNATIATHGSGWGFAHFAGCDGGLGTAEGNANAATYQIDNLAFSARADETFVKVTGFQKTNVTDGKYNVRFVAAVGDIFQGESAVGFEIVATYGDGSTKTWEKTTTTVYNSITAEYGTVNVTADEIGGKYVTAMAITGIPSDIDSVTFTVKPYVLINGAKVYGSTVTVTVHPAA